MVHGQRAATRQRLDELTQLTADLDAVGDSIGDAACGPDCACVRPVSGAATTAMPTVPDRLVGAACTLNSAEMRERLAEWRGLRDRSEAFETLAGGFRLVLDPSESVAAVADLIARESECCSFYTFILSIDGPKRRLDVSAGPGGGEAVRAVLGIEQ